MFKKQERDTYTYIIHRQFICEFKKPFHGIYFSSYLFHCEHCKHGGLQRCQPPSWCPKIGFVHMLNQRLDGRSSSRILDWQGFLMKEDRAESLRDSLSSQQ